MDLIQILADYVVNINEETILSEEVLGKEKMFVFDTIGVGIAGSTAPVVRPVVEQILEWGGKPEATLIVFGQKVPAPWAAFANGLMMHAREFDDVHDQAGIHVNAPILSTILALTERIPQNVTGRTLLSSLVIGTDIACRLALSVPHRKSGWHASSVFGVFGAVAGGGRLLKLDRKTLVNAFGIAYSQTAGNRQCIIDGALTKSMQPAFAAKAAVISLLLAQRGVTGATNIIGGRCGLGNTYFGTTIDKQTVLDQLGTSFEIERLAIKPYPCCRSCHGAIDAIMDLREKTFLSAEDISSVTVRTSERAVLQVGRQFNPTVHSYVDAQFSIPYVVAVALIYGVVTLEHFEEPVLSDKRISDLAARVTVVVDPELSDQTMSVPQTVEVSTHKGKITAVRIVNRRGSSSRPISQEELKRKFLNCTGFSAFPLSSEKITLLIKHIDELEITADIRGIIPTGTAENSKEKNCLTKG